ncbi:hypothetical protein SISSUDRAFT_1065580 [Sistotremastrum suecicum HHB10207 ss-3]|uniref:DUF6532 domain-containing protein n=1 Tax=Sistotremastrum suecicum HHB10207 ss-3 TaxID=1314776 RepID=A0A165ZAY1_9AGAM|nr:hypothetical protein SISSUDRAFT_1065580 [Sistotremastrum suecicum HHB10207 ss-3]
MDSYYPTADENINREINRQQGTNGEGSATLLVPGRLTTIGSGNVLDDHHSRNGMPVPPALEGENASAPEGENTSKKGKKRDLSKKKKKKNHHSAPSVTDDVDIPADTEDKAPTRAPRNSKLDPDRSIPPDQLQYYPDGWRWLLNQATWVIRCTVYTDCPWITKSTGRQEAHECLLEGVRLAKLSKVKLEPGYEIDDHMKNYILNVIPGARGKVRDIALKVVVSHYKVESLKTKHLTVQAKREAITRKVESYLKDGAFLHGKPVKGIAQNFGNDGLRQVVKQAYYGNECIAKRFPAYFAKSVPLAAVGLAATALSFGLDQWLLGYQNTSLQFSGDEYESAYTNIMDGLRKVDEDPFYGPLLRAQLEEWASDGAPQTAKPPRQPISVNLSRPQSEPAPSAGPSRLPSAGPSQRRPSTSPRARSSSTSSSNGETEEIDGPQGDENATSDMD